MSLDDYARHSPWSDPGPHAARLAQLAAPPEALPDALGNLLLHPRLAHMRGIDRPEAARGDAALRTTRELLSILLARNEAPLSVRREPNDRLFVTCRSYALLAAAALRSRGVPARLRVGFADYFSTGFLENHWVCEYALADDDWRLLDAELDAETRQALAIAFSPEDVPRDRFVTAGAAWRRMRSGKADPARMGVSVLSGVAGAWFAAASLLRDAAALSMREVLPWDYWGPARSLGPGSGIAPAWLGRFDDLANALAEAPSGLPEVRARLAEHDWAQLTPTVLSYPDGAPLETAIV